MPINSNDFSISAAGEIRATAAFNPAVHTRYSVLDLHAFLQDLADNATASGDDQVSILGTNPSVLAGKRNETRPSALTLLPAFNLDDAAAKWFRFGSVEQGAGQVLYTGLKVLGSLVPLSPIYIVQGTGKLTKYWSDADTANFQILVKAKEAGVPIAGGMVTVYSRKYGQSYSHFDVDLSAGSEQAAALSTALDGNITLTAAQAEAVFNTLTITVGDVNADLGNGNGSKLYKGRITLNGTTTVAQAYQALQWATSEASTATINGAPGWRYRKLNAAYSENISAPFGSFAGGKWFVARGWHLAGVTAADSRNYQLTAHDDTTQNPPNVVVVQVSGLTSGDYVLVARDNAGSILTSEYTVSAAAGATTLSVTGLKSDTPASGVIRINGVRYTYASVSGTTISGISPALPALTNAPAFIPLIDGTASGASMTSGNIQFDADFVCRYRVRNGGAVSPIVPFESTLSVTSTGGSGTAVRNDDA